MSLTLNELRDQAHQTSKDKGWYDQGDLPPLERHMLMVSEIAEATEEVRKGTPAVYVMNQDGLPSEVQIVSPESFWMTDGDKKTPIKPEGEAIELADVVIRIADYFGKHGWDLDAIVQAKLTYNKTRPYRHGGKKH